MSTSHSTHEKLSPRDIKSITQENTTPKQQTQARTQTQVCLTPETAFPSSKPDCLLQQQIAPRSRLKACDRPTARKPFGFRPLPPIK